MGRRQWTRIIADNLPGAPFSELGHTDILVTDTLWFDIAAASAHHAQRAPRERLLSNAVTPEDRPAVQLCRSISGRASPMPSHLLAVYCEDNPRAQLSHGLYCGRLDGKVG